MIGSATERTRFTATRSTSSNAARLGRNAKATSASDELRIRPRFDRRTDPALQLAALKKAGCKTVFRDDGLSGATTERPALRRCLKKLKAGDTLIVWKLDRLGRSLRDLITMLDELKRRKVKFRSLTEHIDTDTPTGRAMWQMIGLLAELERSLISERTHAGVMAAKRRGVKFGRKRKLTPEQLDHARKLIDKGEHDRQGIAHLFKVSRTTLYRALV